jgi:2-polyprenyl-3-methyl-5-hydroxy-6-metoxy-1,4-benzoquinol methylase
MQKDTQRDVSQASKNTVTENIELYADRIYLEDTTGENFIENIIHATNLPKLISRLRPESLNEPILEMGFGEGTITTPLISAGCTVEIIEGSSKLCADAKSKFGDSVKVHCELFENFDPPEKFQTVLSLHVLEHIDSPRDVINKMFEWLKPGGQVIAVVPNAESFHRQLAVMMGLQPELNSLSPRDKVVGHQRVLTLNELAHFFESAGFSITEKFGYFLKTVPNSMMLDYPPDLIKALTDISHDLPPNLMANIGLVATKP